jgi:hypothetical protein
MTCGRGRRYGEDRAQEGDVMAPEKAGSGTRRHGGTRGKSDPVEPAAGKDAAPGTLVDIDPWSAFFEKFWEEEGGDAGRRDGERKDGTPMPDTKPAKSRRLPRSS